MSVARSIVKRIQRIPKGLPFLGRRFAQFGSRDSVNKTLSRLVKAGTLERVTRGVYMRPKISKYAGKVCASPRAVMKLLTEANGETVQIHGAEAVRFIGLSTQMQVSSTFYTSGKTRELKFGKSTIRLQHQPKDRFQHATTKVGIALTALHYIGKDGLSLDIARHIKKELSKDEFLTLRACQMPRWMEAALNLVTK